MLVLSLFLYILSCKFLFLVTISECPHDDKMCEHERIGFEAIHFLHRQIDDDHNGNLDRIESDGVCIVLVLYSLVN